MGDPPMDSKIAFGGGIPLILDGLPYGDKNIYTDDAPKGLPKIGDPGSANRKYLKQRSKGGYAAQNNKRMGKIIIAFNTANNDVLLITQEHGVEGMTLDEIRDKLIEHGYDNALSFDGSDSATLVTDDEIVIEPASAKNRAIPSGATFQTKEDKKEK